MAFQQRTSFSISAVLPAYNEAAIIERTVRHVASVLGGLVTDFEVIVTNDGSRDATGEILAHLQAHEPELHLRVVTHERNLGYGAALASGFDASRKDLIFLTDGDKQFDVTELSGFIPAMDAQTDMVIGWRKKRADPLMRKLNALGWKTLVNGLFGYTSSCARSSSCSTCGAIWIASCRTIPARARASATTGSPPADPLEVLPPNDPNERFRAELPKLEKERAPVGYRAGWQLEERLQGLGVVVLGLVGLAVVYGVY